MRPVSRRTRRMAWGFLLVAGVGFASMRLLFPCGCRALDFTRPNVIQVKQLPTGCLVLHTPTPWRDTAGKPFDPNWREIDEVDYQHARDDDPKRVHYEVRRHNSSVLYGLGARGSLVRAKSIFRRDGNRLVEASDAEWQVAVALPYIGRSEPPVTDRRVGLDMKATGEHPLIDVLGFEAAGNGWVSMQSYSGPTMWCRDILCATEDTFSLGYVPRIGYIDFLDARKPASPVRPIVYRICGREGWMRHAAAWHGEDVYTMPLRMDGRSFIACEFPVSATPRTKD